MQEAERRFEEYDFVGGQTLLDEAKKSGAGEDTLRLADVNARKSAIALHYATASIMDPRSATTSGDADEAAALAVKLLRVAKSSSPDLILDPEARAAELRAYREVLAARESARRGNTEEAAEAFARARTSGWELPVPEDRLAARLAALETLASLSEQWNTFINDKALTTAQLAESAQRAEAALSRIPEITSGHQLIARFRAAQGDLARAEGQYVIAGRKDASAEPYSELAEVVLSSNPTKAKQYAKKALERDASSDPAWFNLGMAEHDLRNYREAAKALDSVSPSSPLLAQALNSSGAIYFEFLDDHRAAYQRLNQAYRLSPEDFDIASNYAEFLLATRRYQQAKVVARSAYEMPAAQNEENADGKAAMRFVLFSSEFLGGDHESARIELDGLERDVREAGRLAERPSWLFKGITLALQQTLVKRSTELREAHLAVLEFVKSNGRSGSLDPMRKLLKARVNAADSAGDASPLSSAGAPDGH